MARRLWKPTKPRETQVHGAGSSPISPISGNGQRTLPGVNAFASFRNFGISRQIIWGASAMKAKEAAKTQLSGEGRPPFPPIVGKWPVAPALGQRVFVIS